MMSLCTVKRGKYCQCQPDEGVMCVHLSEALVHQVSVTELSDERIHEIFESYGYERDLQDTKNTEFSVIRAVIAADRKLRGEL